MSVSSYLTSSIDAASISNALSAIDMFSSTSYFLNSTGQIEACGPTIAPCNWTSGDVEQFNAAVQRETGAVAQPLVFSNSGDMVRHFRRLLDRTNGMVEAGAFLAARAVRYNYSLLQLDLEPSCWAENASACEWPSLGGDALAYVQFVNATSDALAAVGAKLTVAVGNWPGGQCTPPQEAACNGAGDAYATACEAGAWPVDTCNCCAYYRGWFALDQLCASRAARIVNMDTYQDAPFNESAFFLAIDWYIAHGCAPERTSIGLLVDEAHTPAHAAAVLSAVGRTGSVPAIDIWANLWQQPTQLAAWKRGLETFRGVAPALFWWQYIIPGVVCVALVVVLTIGRIVFIGRASRSAARPLLEEQHAPATIDGVATCEGDMEGDQGLHSHASCDG
jgi:hypothetical protein